MPTQSSAEYGGNLRRNSYPGTEVGEITIPFVEAHYVEENTNPNTFLASFILKASVVYSSTMELS